MKVILPFILNGQTLEKGMNFPKSFASGSKDTLVVKVEGIPEGQNAVAYFSLSWENGKTYNLVFNGYECTIHEYITTLPKATNDFIEYYVTMSVAIFGDAGKRLTTKPIKLVLHKSNYSASADNTPEIPQSQFDAIVEIFNEKVAELDGGDIYLSKDEANYELLKGYIDAGKTVVIDDDSRIFHLQSADDSNIRFHTLVDTDGYVYILDYSPNNEPYESDFVTLTTGGVNQQYDPLDQMPISGQGVAKALETVDSGEKPWQVIEDITLTEEARQIDIPYGKLQGLKELHISAYLLPSDTAATNMEINFGIGGKNYWYGKANSKATGSLKCVMDVSISPRKTLIFDGTVSAYDYTLSGTSYKGLGFFRTADMKDESFVDLGSSSYNIWMRTGEDNLMAAGTRMKVWGR